VVEGDIDAPPISDINLRTHIMTILFLSITAGVFVYATGHPSNPSSTIAFLTRQFIAFYILHVNHKAMKI
jgi:hypothetical protein